MRIAVCFKMKIIVTKNIFVLFVLYVVVGCTGGKLPPPEDPDLQQGYGGTTNQGYVEPMYPLEDTGIFIKDYLPEINGNENPTNENNNKIDDNDKSENENENLKIISPPSPATIPTPINDNNDNNKKGNEKDKDKDNDSVVLFDVGGRSEFYVRTGEVLGLGLLVGDLVDQIDEYILRIGENLNDLKTSENYVTDGDSVFRDASGLAVVVLMVGLSETDSRYRRAAPELLVAVRRLVAAADYKTAVLEFEAVKAALKSDSEPNKLKLMKVVKLKPVMKAMPNLNSNVRRLTNTESKLKRQLARKPKQIFGQLAALAAISEGSIPNGDETLKPTELDKWKSECERFRDVAIKANIAAHDFEKGKIKYEKYWTAFSELSRSCDSCHNTFYPDKKITTEN
jgi:hypothetical protein